jgi:hypothetical protein
MQSPFNVWYLDDGTIGGAVESVLPDFERILASSNELGLCVNDAKCEMLIMHPDDDFRERVYKRFQEAAPNIRQISEEGAFLLGTAITPGAIQPVLISKLEELNRLSESLRVVDAHDALFLLRNCFALPKLLYVLRSAPCFDCPLLADYDQVLRCTLEAILNLTLSDNQWQQASLPVRNGGLGVRCARDVSLPAFLASAHGTSSLVKRILHEDEDTTVGDEPLRLAEQAWLDLSGSAQLPINRKAQKEWDSPLSERKCTSMQSLATDPSDLARLLAVSSPQAGCWLNAIPISSLGLKLDDNQLRIACGLRLGAPLCTPHKCAGCGEEVGPSGTHGLYCKKSAGRHSRHSQVNDLIRRACASAGTPAILEPPGMLRSDGKRPDGVTLIPWKRGRQLVWDFTCCHTMAPSHLAMSSSEAGKAANEAERLKSLKYQELSQNYSFVPFCVETMGAWGTSALKLARELGERIQATTGEPRSTAFFIQAVSMAIQRGNAASVFGTLPDCQGLDEVFDLR